MPDDLPEKSRYHHGDLRHALIAAAESILLERGVEGFSLREAARRAGVSPGAPAHHFGEARGLLTVIATLGFEDLSAALDAANRAAGPERHDRVVAQGHAYVGFALAQPARFDLMWRQDLLNLGDPAHQKAAAKAYELLHEMVTGEASAPSCPDEPYRPDPRVIAAWSMVHGFACLARQNSFDPKAPGLLDGVLACLTV